MVRLLTLECPSCGGKTSFSPGMDRLICEYCGNQHLFQLPDPRPDPPANPPNPVGQAINQVKQRIVPRPAQILVEKRGQSMRLAWKWFTSSTLGLALFCFIWDAFLCFWYGLTLSMNDVPWIMVVFPIGHVAVGIGVTYTVLASFLNTTTVSIDSRNLVVHHDPVPWPGEVKAPVSSIAQLYCTAKQKSSKSGVVEKYQLCAVMKDGRKLELLSDLPSAELGAFLEQEIETWLHITDTPVLGQAWA